MFVNAKFTFHIYLLAETNKSSEHAQTDNKTGFFLLTFVISPFNREESKSKLCLIRLACEIRSDVNLLPPNYVDSSLCRPRQTTLGKLNR